MRYASIRELAERLTRVRELVASARVALAHVYESIDAARQIWATVTSGTGDPVAAQLFGLDEGECARLTECAATLEQVDGIVRAYLYTLGVGEAGSDAPASMQQPPSWPGPAQTPGGGLESRVQEARRRVGRAATAGGEARGEWLRSDGWSVRVTSGAGDEYHEAVVRFVRASKLPPAVARLARHVEVKVAVAMRVSGLRDETIVLEASKPPTWLWMYTFTRVGVTCCMQARPGTWSPMATRSLPRCHPRPASPLGAAYPSTESPRRSANSFVPSGCPVQCRGGTRDLELTPCPSTTILFSVLA